MSHGAASINSRLCWRVHGTAVVRMPLRPSIASAKPISDSQRASRPTIPRCSRRASIPPEASPELRDAGERAFAVLRTAAERLIATMPAQHRPPVLMMTLHIWAMSHGIASLFGRGDAAGRSFPMLPEDLLEAAVLIYLRGLGLTVPPLDDRAGSS